MTRFNAVGGENNPMQGYYGGTGYNNTTFTIAYAGNVVFAGAYNVTITSSGPTTVILPTSGTLVNTAVTTLSSLTSIGTIGTGVWQGTVVAPTYGGTGVANASNITVGGAVTFSGAHPFTGTLTGSTTVTFPTSGTLVPTTVTTLSDLVSIGTISTGVWQGTIVTGTYGGTGVNNGASTITVGGNTAFSGAYTFTGTLTANTSVTFPTSGTLATTNLAITSLTHASSPYTVLAADVFLATDPSLGVVTISLPNSPATGRVIYVKDSTGSAGTHNITITTVGGTVTIDGLTSYVLNNNYQAVSLLFDGVGYEVY